ncbi:hypothetical protein DQ181_13105, partial [Enterococcus faecium]|nr:hypothetical protein [Enterococcus faecium]
LDGVTRRTVVEICKENGLKIIIGDIPLDRISTFDGCFCVGTTTGIVPIKRIEGEVYETKLDLMNRLIFLYKSLFSEKNMYENRKDFVEI